MDTGRPPYKSSSGKTGLGPRERPTSGVERSVTVSPGRLRDGPAGRQKGSETSPVERGTVRPGSRQVNRKSGRRTTPGEDLRGPWRPRVSIKSL